MIALSRIASSFQGKQIPTSSQIFWKSGGGGERTPRRYFSPDIVRYVINDISKPCKKMRLLDTPVASKIVGSTGLRAQSLSPKIGDTLQTLCQVYSELMFVPSNQIKFQQGNRNFERRSNKFPFGVGWFARLVHSATTICVKYRPFNDPRSRS